MDQTKFLELHIFTDLKNLNDEQDEKSPYLFSEPDFEIVLKRSEHFGIGVYKIEAWLGEKLYDTATHEDFKKKTTNPKWYKKAFQTLKMRRDELSYSATYKVSKRLLAR
jgi:hypothetical protein